MRVPSATYRVQFGERFGFDDARAIVPYLSRLGVTDLYASPVFTARPGTSGYHVTDPTTVDPARGGRAGLESLVEELHRHSMGLVLDIVPNHMAASPDNSWWMDVLRHGRASPHASFFDIDWDAHGGKVLVPALGAPLEEAIGREELAAGVERGEPVVRYEDHRFPLDPSTIAGAGTLRELLERQHFVLAPWRDAAREVNYRRFFDISNLVALRQEDPEVFEATHVLVAELVRDGLVTGLRVDHVDGLRDPLEYLHRLRAAAGEECYIVIEKILGHGEELPGAWPVQGTTGYEFSAAALDLFVDPDGENELRRFTADLTGQREPFGKVAAAGKRRVMHELFPGQVSRLARTLRDLPGGKRLRQDDAEQALVALTANLPVYRTYVSGKGRAASRPSPADRRFLERALKKSEEEASGPALRFLRQIVVLERGGPAGLEFVMSWQQLTGPVAAKGIEDTALYVHPVLLARHEVGVDPGRKPAGLAGFHRMQRLRARKWPNGMSTTSTHDSKRSEDVRARIAVLSEIPGEWERRAATWRRALASSTTDVHGAAVPDESEQLVFFQTLLGMWPQPDDDDDALAGRVVEHVVKAAREAKDRTTWMDPDEAHERALSTFVRRALGDEGQRFRKEFLPFQRRVAQAGAAVSLARSLLKIASPGTPDFYQGTELWNFTLVDPDNRRPVDFAEARSRLDRCPEDSFDPKAAAGLLRRWPDGRIKLHVTAAALRFRREHQQLFELGEYLPLEATGRREEHVCTFARRRGSQMAVVVVPRLATGLVERGRFPVGTGAWSGTSIALPPRSPMRWRNVLTGETSAKRAGSLRLVDLFRTLPVALLTPAA